MMFISNVITAWMKKKLTYLKELRLRNLRKI